VLNMDVPMLANSGLPLPEIDIRTIRLLYLYNLRAHAHATRTYRAVVVSVLMTTEDRIRARTGTLHESQ